MHKPQLNIQTAIDLLRKVPSGEKLIKGLGLSQFEHIIIQKIINLSIPVFVVTVDSRYKNRPITDSRLRKLDSTQLFKAKKYTDIIEPKKIVFTPPLPLRSFKGDIPTDSLIIQRDIAGEYFNDSKMYESIEIDNKKIRVN